MAPETANKEAVEEKTSPEPVAEAAEQPPSKQGGEPSEAVDRNSAEVTTGGESSIFPELTNDPLPESMNRDKYVQLLRDVSLKVKVELGRGKMLLKDILRLTKGSVVELDRLAGDSLNIYVNDRLIAKGEVLVLNENFCIRITEILTPEQCSRSKKG